MVAVTYNDNELDDVDGMVALIGQGTRDAVEPGTELHGREGRHAPRPL